MTSSADPLRLFDPLIRQWFLQSVGEPTEVQRIAWPAIATGGHALVIAPTGSGKTLAAFLWALDRLLTGVWQPGRVRVLYISPLRALGNDIHRNLLGPLDELASLFGGAGRMVPDIRVSRRTGDTSQAERRRIQKQPPEILITTPESLNILLTSRSGSQLLTDIHSVILDEVHAVVGAKRGVHLMSGVERLTELSGEFQRIGLSATVNPRERVARWLGGSLLDNQHGVPVRRDRKVATVVSEAPKAYEVEVDLPLAESGASRDPESLWTELATRLKRRVVRNRSTLIFGNSRRTVEKVARFLNEDEPTQLAYSHHGALSREVRSVVEDRLKAGSLKAIVATNSLELGIDIGSIDEVAMVQPPPTVASATQRLGRSGHGVGQTSRGTFYPLHALALLESAVLIRAVLDGELEPIEPITNPLDVLAQIVVSMTVRRRWHLDDLFEAVRGVDAYRHLSRRQFDLVLEMLAGRYASTRLRSLRPLVAIDGVDNTVIARPGAERLVYLSGGTIPDRGYFNLRVEGSGAPLGQLDEEFVWERSVGDTFSLGVQIWKVQRITHNDVFVSATAGGAAMAPFWRAEERDRSSFVSDRIGRFLERAIDRLDDDEFVEELVTRHHLRRTAAAELKRLLAEQLASTGTLPHRHQVVVEHTAPPSGRTGTRQMVLHTMWGGRVNRPFSYALAAAWQDATGLKPDILHGDDCVVITYPVDEAPEDVFAMVPSHRVEELLRRTLEDTGFFGARFREAAGRSLLLPRGGQRRRVPLWLNRQRAKELLDAVSDHGDFPLVLEAWRECAKDEFELAVLKSRLEEIDDGSVAVRHIFTETPSPFSEQVAWRQTNRLMYEDDRPMSGGSSRLNEELVREIAFSSHLRPSIPLEIVRDLQGKLHRTAPGYAPATVEDLVEWTKDRLAIPADEWRQLVAAMSRDHDIDVNHEMPDVGQRVVTWLRPDTGRRLVIAVELLPTVASLFGWDVLQLELFGPFDDRPPDPGAVQALETVVRRADREEPTLDLAEFLTQWLAFYGPVPPAWIADSLALDVDQAIEDLASDGTLVLDQISEGSEGLEVCDRENLERLLRLTRAAARPLLEPFPIEALPLMLAKHQKLGMKDATIEDLKSSLETLFGLPIPAGSLETELLPARLEPYFESWLDTLMSDTDLGWFGVGTGRIALALETDRHLFMSPNEAPEDPIDDLFPQELGRYTVDELMRTSKLSSHQLMDVLWRGAWSGALTTDTFAPLRHGIATGFATQAMAPHQRPRSRRRARFDRWRSRHPLTGTWMRLWSSTLGTGDALDREEDDRERARILLDRYGVLFREVVERELPDLRWRHIFRSLRMLELAGEVVAGRFFDRIPGLQFVSKPALRLLQEQLSEDRVWWINATDPASPCGLGPFVAELGFPRRISSNHLVFHGRRLVVVSERRGKALTIHVAEDHPRLPEYLDFLRVQLARSARPRRSITVETINDQPATSSPYRIRLEEICQVVRTPLAIKLSRRA